MEYACFIKQKEDINNLESQFTRVYFGEELCENKFPSSDRILETYFACKRKGLHFTLVTCVFSNDKIEMIKELIEKLISLNDIIEIVINDVGVLYYCMNLRVRNIEIIIGRLLNKAARTPRYQNIKDQLNSYQEEVFGCTMFMNKLSSEFFGINHSVIAYELDNMEQLRIPDEYSSNTFHLLMPYVLVTVTRNCLFHGIRKMEALSRKRTACYQECRNYALTMEHVTLIDSLNCIGSGIFYKNDNLDGAICSKISRVVVNSYFYNLGEFK